MSVISFMGNLRMIPEGHARAAGQIG